MSRLFILSHTRKLYSPLSKLHSLNQKPPHLRPFFSLITAIMYGKAKRKDTSDDSFIDDGGDTSPRPKKTAKVDNDDEDGGITVCEISKNRKVSVRTWQGKVIVDIREFYVKDGKQMPGRKGISLPMDQWKVLCEHVDQIDNAVAENN